MEKIRRRQSSLRSLATFAAGAAAGAAVGAGLAYLLDPDVGRRRRRLLQQRGAALARRRTRALARRARAAALRARGRARGLLHRLHARPHEPVDDVTLAHKVETVLFRDQAVPKGKISINAEGGSVFLRGEVERPELIHDLEERVRAIAGVRRVENLLHLPGTPAPTARGGRLIHE
jgi:osmotically-inducible protein OsmY